MKVRVKAHPSVVIGGLLALAFILGLALGVSI